MKIFDAKIAYRRDTVVTLVSRGPES
jgi:hypothetical protein